MTNPETQNNDDEVIEADLTGTGDGSFVFPDGDYPMRITDIKRDVSKASGKPMLVWSLLGGPELRNNTFKVFTSFAPEAIWKMGEMITACGVGKNGEKVTFKKSDCIGKMVMATLEKSEFDGKKRSSVAKCKPFVSNGLPTEDIPF